MTAADITVSNGAYGSTLSASGGYWVVAGWVMQHSHGFQAGLKVLEEDDWQHCVNRICGDRQH